MTALCRQSKNKEENHFSHEIFVSQKQTGKNKEVSQGESCLLYTSTSYILLPENDAFASMSMTIKIKDYSITGQDAKRTGVFVGAFQTLSLIHI